MITSEDLEKLVRKEMIKAAHHGMLNADYTDVLEEIIALLESEAKRIAAEKMSLYKLGQLADLTPAILKTNVRNDLEPIIKKAKIIFDNHFNRKIKQPNQSKFDEIVNPKLDSVFTIIASEFAEYQTKNKHGLEILVITKRSNKIALGAISISLLTLLISIFSWIGYRLH